MMDPFSVSWQDFAEKASIPVEREIFQELFWVKVEILCVYNYATRNNNQKVDFFDRFAPHTVTESERNGNCVPQN